MHSVCAMENVHASMIELVAVATFWVVWCGLHSLLISHAFMALMERRFPALMPWYRVGYNLFALLSLVPVVFYTYSVGGEVVLSWQGWGIALRAVLLLLALLLFYGGAVRYDMLIFLGVRQVREKRLNLLLSDSVAFSRSGVFRVTRHPWYLGSMFFIWSAFCCYSDAMLAAVVVLTVYLVVGARLEEQKILQKFPEDYGSYRRDVSMLFPWKWLCRILAKRNQELR